VVSVANSIQDGDKELKRGRTNFESNIIYKKLRGDLGKNENIILKWKLKSGFECVKWIQLSQDTGQNLASCFITTENVYVS
jgi:hypothetical protein